MNRVRTEEETGIEEEKSELIPVFVCVKTDGRWWEADGGRGPQRADKAPCGTAGHLRIDGWRLRY